MSNTLAKCSCSHCDGHLEFDTAYAGERVTCPHCDKETLLYIPGTDSAPPTPSPAPPPAPPAAQAAYRLTDPIGLRAPAPRPTAAPLRDAPPRNPNPFARQAARASWISFIFACLFGVFVALFHSLKRSMLKEIILGTVLLLPLLGFALGLIALFGIRKHGIKDILLPAVIGLVLNGLFIGWLLVPAILVVVHRRHEFQERKRHVAVTQFTEPAVSQDTSADSAVLRTTLAGKWVMDPEGTIDVIARSQFGKRQQVIRLQAKPGQPPAYRTNFTNKPFNVQEYEQAKAEALRGFHSTTNLQLPSVTFAADGTGKLANPNRPGTPAGETAFQWHLDGDKVMLKNPVDGHTNQFQFTNQTQISVPFWAERGLFIVFKREGAK
jgi:hypothetical protein